MLASHVQIGHFRMPSSLIVLSGHAEVTLIAMGGSKGSSLEPNTNPDELFNKKTGRKVQVSLKMTNRSKDTNETNSYMELSLSVE